MEKKRRRGKYITDENNNNASLSLSRSVFFSLRALIPCPAKHWANVELFRSLVRSMTRRAHLHLCCFSSIMNIKIGCHSIFKVKKQKKRFIRYAFCSFSSKNISQKINRRKFSSFRNDYYANEYCIDIFQVSVCRSI